MIQKESRRDDSTDGNYSQRVSSQEVKPITQNQGDSTEGNYDTQPDSEDRSQNSNKKEVSKCDELLIAMPDLLDERSDDSDSSTESPNIDPDASDRLVSTIGATSVIDALEQLSYQRKYTATEVAYLKHRYLKLCSCLAL